MTAPRPRRWFQIHFNTGVVLVIIASALLWANMKAELIGSTLSSQDYTRGWPWPMQLETLPNPRGKMSPSDPRYGLYYGTTTSGERVAMNMAVSFTIFFTMAFVSEFLIRRYEARKRLLFQIRLSTAVALMFAAALLLWANCRPHLFIDKWEASMTDNPGEGLHYHLYGWPVVGAFHGPMIPRDQKDIEIYGQLDGFWNPKPLVIDFCIAFILLTAVLVFCEFLARRREARKP